MRPQEFHRLLAKGPLGTAYCFSGGESLLKLRAIEALVAGVPTGIRDFNLNVFFGNEAETAEVIAAARTIPFLAPRRLVILRDVEKMRLTERRADLIEEYLKAPALTTTFVITTDDPDAAKTLRKRYAEWWVEVDFAPLRGAQMEEEVRREVVRLGCRIAPAAVGVLLEAVGDDLGRVHLELEKLRVAVGEGGLIGEAEVRRHVAGYLYQTQYDLLNAVSARNLAGSLRLLSQVVAKQDEALMFMGLLGKRLRLLWLCAAGRKAVPPVFRVYPSQLELLRRDAARFTREELERGLVKLLDIDTAIKNTAGSPRLLLENYLIHLLAGR